MNFNGPSVRCMIKARLALITFMLAALAACSLGGGNRATLGSEAILSGQAFLLCTESCSERGQCGSSDAGSMVLLSTVAPATQGHNMAVAAETAVAISLEQPQTVVQVSDQQPIQVSYYLVDVPGRGLAWVAGWCLSQ
jgi:hypothetical protein